MTPPRPPERRLVVGIDDPAREQDLLEGLLAGDAAGGAPEWILAGAYLSAPAVLEAVRAGEVDAALLDGALHRATPELLRDISRHVGLLLVLGRATPPGGEYRGLPAGAGVAEVRAALEDPAPLPAAPPPRPVSAPSSGGRILAIAGGHGSPGRTTVALGLATALGAIAPTVLLELDLVSPALAAFLDLDPLHGLLLVRHEDPATDAAWQRVLAAELQPLGPRSPQGQVLCGLSLRPSPPALRPGFVEALLRALEARCAFLVVDLGPEPAAPGPEAAVQGRVLERAGDVLLVAVPDIPGQWRAQQALRALEGRAKRPVLILNRFGATSYPRSEVEYALQAPVGALLPADDRRAAHALAAQRSLVLEGGPAAAALLDLAGRIAAHPAAEGAVPGPSRIILPPDPDTVPAGERLRAWLRQHSPAARRKGEARGAA